MIQQDGSGCCPPQGRELLLEERFFNEKRDRVAVPRRGASCYGKEQTLFYHKRVAVPHRGASCCDLTETLYHNKRNSCCPPQGRELLLWIDAALDKRTELLSPAGARVVT